MRPNLDCATKFIDFMVSPEFYVKWDTDVGAPASANNVANAQLPADAFNRIVLGEPDVQERLFYMAPLTDEQRKQFTELWETGEDRSRQVKYSGGPARSRSRGASGKRRDCKSMPMAASTLSGSGSAAGRRRWAVFGLTAPAYFWLTLTVLLPLSAMLYFSFLTVAPIGARVPEWTLGNYLDFFRKGFYLTLTGRSLMLGLCVTGLCLLLGFPAALALAKYVKGRWREALFLLIVLPFWSNALVRTFSWTMVLRTDGMVDDLLQAVFPGRPISTSVHLPAVVIGLVHSFLPYMILTCYISLQAIDDSLLEAARSLGAAGPTVFRRIMLPLSLPGILAGTILIFVPVIGSFMEPRILGGRGGFMLGNVIEDQFTVVFNWPLGAALSFILLAIVLLILAACYPLLRRNLQGLA